MIQFRCWYCRKTYRVAEHRIGERITCSCQRHVRVPKQNGGHCRVRTLGDWLIELVLCGGGGAFLGACLAVLIISRAGLVFRAAEGFFGLATLLLIGLTLLGLVLGSLTGTRGLDRLGRKIRERENS